MTRKPNSKGGWQRSLVPEATKKASVLLYVEGRKSSCEIAQAFRVHPKSVANWVKAAGYKLRTRKEAAQGR